MMIELMATISGPMSLMSAFLGVVWILRCEKCVFIKDGIMPLLVLMYATWHFVAHADIEPNAHLIIHNLFIMLTSITIAIQCKSDNLPFKVNRRKKNKNISFDDRRKK